MSVVFDLDGTLLNTLEGHAGSFNRALQSLGLPAHGIDAYRYFIGDGATRCAERAVPAERRGDQSLIEACVSYFRQDYEQTWHQTTRPYAGINDMLGRLQDAGLLLAVLSNKDHAFTDQMVRTSFDAIRFACVAGYGYRGIVQHKPDPSGPGLIAEVLGQSTHDLAMVGDTATDMTTATACHMLPIGVSWGFRDRAELEGAGARHIIARPAELPDLLLQPTGAF
jgi:phosphoglycolate phosphatase